MIRTARAFAILVLLAATFTGVASAVAVHLVRFKGNAIGAVVAAVPTKTGVQLTVHASGNATHLGNFTRVEQLLLNPATGAVTGSIVFVAANGDELYATVTGGFVSETVAVGTYAIGGGTGRFVGAAGRAAFRVETPDGAQFSVSFNGEITSVGG